VAAVIEVDEDIPLDPFISAASSLVDRLEKVAIQKNLLIDDEDGKSRDEKLAEIETWLAAHFYAMRDPRVVSEGAGPVNATYQSAVALRLMSSQYGQMACTLDETGYLEAVNSGRPGGPRKVGVFWGGKNPCS